MTAQASKPPVKIRKPRPGSKAEAILTLATTTPATRQEIAQAIQCSWQNVDNTLRKYQIDPNASKSFKEHRAEILAGMQERIISQLDDERLKKASVNNLAYAYQQFHSAERLERGQSTANIASQVGLTPALQEAVDRVCGRDAENAKVDQNPSPGANPVA